jgi:hypothetical protein
MMTRPEASMTDPATAAARAAAISLKSELGPGLPSEVEAALAIRHTDWQRPDQYDPATIAGLAMGAASLIVTIAQLAWSIYSDQRAQSPEPSPEAIARQIRITLRQHEIATTPSTDRITDVVITEITRLKYPPQ